MSGGKRLLDSARIRSLAVMALFVPLGLGTKRYQGPAQAWVHDSAGDVLYAAFCFFALQAAAPRFRVWQSAVAVTAFCAVVELTQFLHSPWLDAFRATPFGHLLLGSDFEAADFVWYALGAGLAALGARGMKVRDAQH
jgi:uncharacterized protein DUF2809